MSTQGEFAFDADPAADGYCKWLTGRKVAADELARRMGLPLDHQAEVWLVGGIRLRGKLRLQEETLFIEENQVRHLGLRVDQICFDLREMESCIRLD